MLLKKLSNTYEDKSLIESTSSKIFLNIRSFFMICYYVAKFRDKVKKTLESNKFIKLNDFHFKIINDYANSIQDQNK